MVKATDSNEIISELTVNEQIFVAARGGCGGHGNHYYLSNKLRAPQKAEIGGVGELVSILLTLYPFNNVIFGCICARNASARTCRISRISKRR